jgi:hypothetical protein
MINIDILIYYPLHVSVSRWPSSEGSVCQHVGNYHYNVMYVLWRVVPLRQQLYKFWGVNLLLTPTCHEPLCPWQVINAIVYKMLVLLADTFTITVTVTTITGPVLLVSLHWLHWCSFSGHLLASNWTVRNYNFIPISLSGTHWTVWDSVDGVI